MRIAGWGSVQKLVMLKYRTYVHANQNPTGADPNMTREMKKKEAS